MKHHSRTYGYTAIGLFIAFLLWTLLLCFTDVKPIGPNGSAVGFSTLNGSIHNAIGVHMPLYVLTDWLGLVPIAIMFGFAVFGLVQWIRRKSICRVDADILLLGGFYLAVLAAYITFEFVVINRRPVLIDGILEASYPSSTTMLVLCVIPTTILQWCSRIHRVVLRRAVILLLTLFMFFMVIGRLVSGVHWFSDIVGGTLLSMSLVTGYNAIVNILPQRR